ncbi:MAG TPA: acetamidase/formamidase family protein [Steroidobacteraceae bacterium]|nr:acetamidase/formamidase family protein [Steroidobacteraceae bacterium]
MTHRHTIHAQHFGWDNSLAPVVRIAPGRSLEFEVTDASGGQLSRASAVAGVGQLDFARINPAAGPVYVDGAEPGDILKVTVLSFAPSGWGWTAPNELHPK